MRYRTFLLGIAIVVFCLLSSVSSKTQPRPSSQQPSSTGPRPGVSVETNSHLDTLLASDSYACVMEYRTFGREFQPGGMFTIISQQELLLNGHDSVTRFILWSREHSGDLLNARLLFATMPARPGIPDGLVLLELASPEQAQTLKADLDKYLATPAPTVASLRDKHGQSREAVVGRKPSVQVQTPHQKASPALHVQQIGNVLALTESQFELRELRPKESPSLLEWAHYQAVASRFSGDSCFLLFDLSLMDKAQKIQNEKYAAQQPKIHESNSRLTSRSQGAQKVRESTEETNRMEAGREAHVETPAPGSDEKVTRTEGREQSDAAPVAAELAQPAETEVGVHPEPGTAEANASDQKQSTAAANISLNFSAMMQSIASQATMPPYIGGSARVESDSLVLRLLIGNNSGIASPFPFVPGLISGPPLNPGAPSYAPANSAVLIDASFDLIQTFNHIMSAVPEKPEETAGRPNASDTARENPAASMRQTIAALESLYDFSFRDDVLSSLGNEVAVCVPPEYLTSTGTPSPAGDLPGPVLLISLRDGEHIRKILPKILGAIGLTSTATGSDMGGTGKPEVLDYGSFSLAYVENFLIAGFDSQSVRRMITSYESGSVLSQNDSYRLSAAWQPSQALVQSYVSGAILKQLLQSSADNLEEWGDQPEMTLSLRFASEPLAVTHAASGDVAGALHEIHLPKLVLELWQAEALVRAKHSSEIAAEERAMEALRAIAIAQQTYHSKKADGQYASSTDELVKTKALGSYFLKGLDSYKIQLNASSGKFEVTAAPTEYGKTGKRSFFIDESLALRGGDHAGGTATVSDKVIPQ